MSKCWYCLFYSLGSVLSKHPIVVLDISKVIALLPVFMILICFSSEPFSFGWWRKLWRISATVHLNVTAFFDLHFPVFPRTVSGFSYFAWAETFTLMVNSIHRWEVTSKLYHVTYFSSPFICLFNILKLLYIEKSNVLKEKNPNPFVSINFLKAAKRENHLFFKSF